MTDSGIEADGSLYDRPCDPPCQESVYIAPGDAAIEWYRLSTFLKFPQDAPVNLRHLAAAGFHYTGYKDRVKCFCCGLCVENWCQGDDVKSTRWHRNNCEFINGQDSGNQPIEGGSNIQEPPDPSEAEKASVSVYTPGDAAMESYRLSTFVKFPQDTPVNPRHLAAAGFYYTGYKDKVKCFCCGLCVENWCQGDDVKSTRWHSNNCEFINGQDSGNQPIEARSNIQEPPDPSEAKQQDLENMFRCQYPASPYMRNEESRLETYDHRWPSTNIRATPQQIAKAGFFFLGDRDRVKCWYCNGGLQNWDPDDEPWTEHAKWFPSCEFLLQRKGPDFVHRMVSLYPNLPRPILRGPFDVPPRTSGKRRTQSPPPPIIDHRAEVAKQNEKLAKFMKTDLVKVAIEMGFEVDVIKKMVNSKLSSGGSLQTTVAGLVDDITSYEPSDDEDEEEPVAASKSTNVKTPVFTPSMEARLRELQEERKCKICLDRVFNIVFVPCGHLCCCSECSEGMKKCPICFVKILSMNKILMS